MPSSFLISSSLALSFPAILTTLHKDPNGQWPWPRAPLKRATTRTTERPKYLSPRKLLLIAIRMVDRREGRGALSLGVTSIPAGLKRRQIALALQVRCTQTQVKQSGTTLPSQRSQICATIHMRPCKVLPQTRTLQHPYLLGFTLSMERSGLVSTVSCMMQALASVRQIFLTIRLLKCMVFLSTPS